MSNQISFIQLLSGNPIADVPMLHQQNLQELQKRVNIVLAEYNAQSYIITSGYRTLQHHLEIYSRKGLKPPNVPMNSAHLTGEACDIYDPDLHLTDWLKNDRIGCTMLQKHDLYCEEGNKDWVHMQTRASKYGHWFKP